MAEQRPLTLTQLTASENSKRIFRVHSTESERAAYLAADRDLGTVPALAALPDDALGQPQSAAPD